MENDLFNGNRKRIIDSLERYPNLIQLVIEAVKRGSTLTGVHSESTINDLSGKPIVTVSQHITFHIEE